MECISREKGWIVSSVDLISLRKSKLRGFSPLYGVKYYDGDIWVATYSSDYFKSLILKTGRDDFELSGLRFVYSPHGSATDAGLAAIEEYERGGFKFKFSTEDVCGNKNEIKISVYKRGGVENTWNYDGFIKFKAGL